MALGKGDVAPHFDLDRDDGGRFRSAEQAGRPYVVMFYADDDTEGCTTENREFSALLPEFQALGVDVVAVSPNTVADHCAFRDKYQLTVPLLADPERQAIEAYGVWGAKVLYGRPYTGLIRSTFLVGRDGRIAEAWTVRRIKGHAAQVLEAARKMVG